MRSRIGFLAKASILALTLPVLGFSAAFEVNGTCQAGSDCSVAGLTASALTIGTSTNGSYTFNVTLGDGDAYKVTGSYFQHLWLPPQQGNRC